MNYNHTKNCAWCNRQFNSQRQDAKFCSSTCRVRYHKGKKEKNNSYEAFNNNLSSVLNISNDTNINKNVFSDAVNKDVLRDEDIKYIVENKKSFLKFFLLAHKDEINKLIYGLNLFSEEEYATVSNFASRAIDLLVEIENNPNILSEKMEEIKELTLEYEEQ